jgi:molybdopterin converting factor small subunit
MGATIELEASLQRYAGSKASIWVNGNTVNECLADLIKQYPGIKPILFDAKETVYDYVSVFIGKEMTKKDMVKKKDFNNPIPDGTNIHIIYFLEGG